MPHPPEQRMGNLGERRHVTIVLAGLVGLAALTRVPFAGMSWGESDAARYLLGVEQWLRLGPRAPLIYGKELSPGYYAVAVAWVRHFHTPPLTFLNSISLWAALLSAPLLYVLGRRLGTPSAAAVAAAVLFLLAPGFWWLGIEPHPEGVALLGLLVALAVSTSGPRVWKVPLATAALTMALLFKADLLLLTGIFPVWAGASDEGCWRWRRAIVGLGVPAGALAAFLLLRNPMLHAGWRQSQQLTLTSLRQFWSLPQGTGWLKQLLPLATAAGWATALVVAAGLALGACQPGWRRRWLPRLAVWVLPGGLFWLLVRGNNVRHVAALWLLPLMAGLEALARWPLGGARRARLAALCAVAIGANLCLPPPSSNLTLYPSPNLPASVRLLAARTAELRAFLAQQQQRAGADGGPVPCFLGNATLPYLEFAARQAAPAASLEPLPGMAAVEAVQMAQAGAPTLRFIQADTPEQARAAARRCRARFGAASTSLEFTAAAARTAFFGREWRSLPWRQRWYPGVSAGSAIRH